MGKKQDYQRMAQEAAALRGQVGEFRTGLESYRTAARPDVELQRGTFRGMIEDPTKRGYSPEAVSSMYAKSGEAAAGARGSFLKGMRQQVAAQGLGNTGAALRLGTEYDKNFQAQQRGSMRDINLANEEAKRSDLWNALGGLGNVQAQENQFNLANLGMQQGTFGQQMESFTPQLEAYKQAYAPGFWSRLAQGMLTSAVGGAGGAFGAGAAAKFFK